MGFSSILGSAGYQFVDTDLNCVPEKHVLDHVECRSGAVLNVKVYLLEGVADPIFVVGKADSGLFLGQDKQ